LSVLANRISCGWPTSDAGRRVHDATAVLPVVYPLHVGGHQMRQRHDFCVALVVIEPARCRRSDKPQVVPEYGSSVAPAAKSIRMGHKSIALKATAAGSNTTIVFVLLCLETSPCPVRFI